MMQWPLFHIQKYHHVFVFSDSDAASRVGIIDEIGAGAPKGQLNLFLIVQ